MAASAGGALWVLRSLGDASASVAHTRDVIVEAEGLVGALVEAESAQRGFLLTGEERYLGPYEAAAAGLGPALDRLRALVADNPAQAARLPALREAAERRLAVLAEAVARRRAGDAEGALATLRAEEGRRWMDALRAAVAAFGNEERRLLAERFAAASRRSVLAAGLVGLAGLLAVALAAVAALNAVKAQRRARERAERALSEEEAHARAVLDLNPQVPWTARPDGGIEDFAGRWLTWTGLTREQALGDGWASVPHPDDLPWMAEAWRRSVETGEPYDVEHRIRLADGSFRWMRSRAVPRRDPATGAVLRWYGTTEDVHDRREAEAALRQSEERLRLFIERAPAAIAMFDAKMRYLAASRRFLLDYGLPFGDVGAISGRGHYELFPDVPERWREVHRRVLAGETLSAEDDPFPRADGRTDWIRWEMTPWHRADGSVGGALLFSEVVTARVEAERALAEGEARFRAVADNIPQLAWMARPDGWIVWYNRRWFDYTGTTFDEMQGWGWRKVHHPDHVERVLARFRGSVETGEPWEDTFPLRGADGTWRWFLSRALPVRDGEGRTTLWFGTNTDVTESREAEAALRASEARLRAAIALAPFPILLHAEDGEILQASEAWQEISGWRWPEDIPTVADWTERAYGERRDAVRADIDRLYALDRRVDEGDYTIRTKRDGPRVWSFGSAPVGRDARGRRLAVSMAADVTDLRRAEAELRRALAEQRAVYASAPVALGLHGRDLRFRAVNSRMAALNGLPAEAHIGRTPGEAVPAIAEAVEPLLRRVLETGEPVGEVEIETETAAHPGERRHYLAAYYPVREEGGDGVDGVSVAVLDITVRKRAEAAARDLAATLEARVEERTRRLAEVVAELDSFAYTVSHDLRAPLRAMEGFARILEEEHGEALDAAGRRYARRIVEAAERLDGLIQDLLAYSRLSRAEVEPRPTSLEEAVDRALKDLPDGAAEVTVERPLPPALGARAVLGAMLGNLLSNAVKFAEAGRKPRVRIRAEARPGGRVRLWVEDDGIGIAPEHLDRIFQVFERLHGQEHYPGTGIGLAIVRKGAERLGGAAGAESDGPGRGSRFWVELSGATGA